MRTVGNGARWPVMGLAILGAVGAFHMGFPARGGTTPPGQTPPLLDTSGIEIIRKIPVGKFEVFHDKALIDHMLEDYSEEELRAVGYNLIPAELILSSISSLVIKQMALERYAKVNSVGITVAEGEFGEKLWEILTINPRKEGGVRVEHVELRDLAFWKRDCYRMIIGSREIELELSDGFMGFDWGVRSLLLRRVNEDYRTPKGTPYVEEKELFIHQVESKVNPGTYIMEAFYTVRLYKPDGTLVRVDQWVFVQGNPSSVFYQSKVFDK